MLLREHRHLLRERWYLLREHRHLRRNICPPAPPGIILGQNFAAPPAHSPAHSRDEMYPRSLIASLAFAILVAGTWLIAPSASSAPPAAEIQVENAWIPQPPPGTDVAAAYLTLRNVGHAPAVLVGVSSPVAASAAVHQSMIMQGESMMMPVERLTIRPGETVTLKPNGLHVMLNSVRKPLQVGERVPLVLRFASGEELHVSAQVRPLGSQ